MEEKQKIMGSTQRADSKKKKKSAEHVDVSRKTCRYTQLHLGRGQRNKAKKKNNNNNNDIRK